MPLPKAALDALAKLDPGAPDALVFAREDGRPIDAGAVGKRAAKAWRAAGLDAITLHDARHVFASFAIAAGVNLKQLAAYMGHASITITLDRYGHLLPGSDRDAAELLDRYLNGAVLGQSAAESTGLDRKSRAAEAPSDGPKTPAKRSNAAVLKTAAPSAGGLALRRHFGALCRSFSAFRGRLSGASFPVETA